MTTWFLGQYSKNEGAVAITKLWGYLDIQDDQFAPSSLREDVRRSRFRESMSELRGGMIECHPVIGLLQDPADYTNATPIPHVGYPSFPPIPENEPASDGVPASRYFGMDILVAGKADVVSLFGGYQLLGGKARMYISGGSFLRMGAQPLEKDPPPF